MILLRMSSWTSCGKGIYSYGFVDVMSNVCFVFVIYLELCYIPIRSYMASKYSGISNYESIVSLD